jgi:uncharacterized protein
MGYAFPSLILFILLNLITVRIIRSSINVWILPAYRRRVLLWISVILLIINLPLSVFFYRPLDALLGYFPPRVMGSLFLPSFAWLMTLLFSSLTLAALAASTAIIATIRRLFGRNNTGVEGEKRKKLCSTGESPKLTFLPDRRRFLTGSFGLALPAFYGVSTYGLNSGLDNLEISPQLPIAIPDLPSALDGFRITQISDIHVGPYLRKRELEEIVVRVNALRADVVVITGDLIDRDLGFLPETVSALRGLRSTFGSFMVLGNHDVAADPTNTSTRHRAGEHIAKAVSAVGIQTLRDQVVMVGEGREQLALMGLDWIDPRRGPSYLYYDSPRTIRALKTMHERIAPKTPKVLLAHHPETFTDAIPFQIGLTLAGHTHGGGQVVLGDIAGQPVGVAMLRFKYLRGLYEQGGMKLYVNRGIGYIGLPLRINCPPEISQFQLHRANFAT